jgi:RNA polymerase sigma-70 factor, ECF subfamily
MSSRRKRRPRESDREAMKNVQSTVDTVVRRMIGSRDPEYEDLVQSSLVNVLATIDRGNFRGECPPGGWAAVIARNVAVDAIRARARERRVFAQEGWDEVVAGDGTRSEADLGPERLTDLHLTLDRVNSALAGLGPKKARVVYLHDVLGYQLGEVATMLGTSVAAAQSRLVRGRREIIETMGPEAQPAHGRGRHRMDAAQGVVDRNDGARPRRRRRRPAVLT